MINFDPLNPEHVKIKQGSDMLREALLLAYRGIETYTPEEPAGLPKGAKERTKSAQDGRKGGVVTLPPESDDERVLRLYSKGHTANTIAKMMGYHHWGVAQGALARIKNRKPGVYWKAAERHAAARGFTK